MSVTPTRPIRRVQKGWGYELWIHNAEDYCGKILVLYADKQCSLHSHRLKSETFYIQSGRLSMRTLDDVGRESTVEMCTGEVLEIPPGICHQFTGIAERTEIVEFSTQHFDEDSIRLEQGD